MTTTDQEKECRTCKHCCEGTFSPSRNAAMCTRYPEWQLVKWAHYCGEFEICEEHRG